MSNDVGVSLEWVGLIRYTNTKLLPSEAHITFFRMERFLHNTNYRQISDANVVSSDSVFIYRFNPMSIKKQHNNKKTETIRRFPVLGKCISV